MTCHYVYNKEGVAAFLGLSETWQVKRYKDNAIKAGVQPSHIVGGIEMFDIDILMNPEKYIQTKNVQNSTKKRVQLCLF